VFVVTRCCEDVTTAKCTSHFGAQSTNTGVVVGGVGGLSAEGVWQDTGSQVTIHVRVPCCIAGLVVRPRVRDQAHPAGLVSVHHGAVVRPQAGV